MRYLAIDYGERRVGLAICDPSETIVSPLCQLDMPAAGWPRLVETIHHLAAENQAESLVVGLPLNMDGSEGPQAKRVRQFGQTLAQAGPLPVVFHDERLSSSAADDLMADVGLTARQRKQKRDMLAACHVLRGFLDQHHE